MKPNYKASGAGWASGQCSALLLVSRAQMAFRNLAADFACPLSFVGVVRR